MIAVGKAHRVLNYCSVGSIGLVHKVNVTCCTYRLAELIGKLYYRAVEVLQLLIGVYYVFTQHIAVVAYRLYFQIVIEVGYLQKVLPGLCLIHHSHKKLTLRAGTSDDKTLTVSCKHGLRNPRSALEVIKVRHRDQLIQVFKSCIVAD